jgi:hypothetical protein
LQEELPVEPFEHWSRLAKLSVKVVVAERVPDDVVCVAVTV